MAPAQDAPAADDLTLFATEHWTIAVRRVQLTLGALTITANRRIFSAADLSPAEVAELPYMIGRLESTLKGAFQYDRINYICLMMIEPRLHFHALPRYAAARTFAGRTWQDAAWPDPPILTGDPTETPLLLGLRDHLRTHLPRA